jgi:hypothetical protein
MGDADLHDVWTREPDDGSLSPQLADRLDPEFRDAFDHPIRREILRTFDEGRAARSAPEITAALSPFTRPEINYHVQVLLRNNALRLDGVRPAPGGRQRFYVTDAWVDVQAEAVLRATERRDGERRREAAGRRSSGLLTMFRIPRPTRTIRLCDRRGRGPEEGR